MKSYVVLDRDYRPDFQASQVVSKLSNLDITAHIWRRKELESYLLNAEVMARLSGASTNDINHWLDEAFDLQETHVFSQMLDERVRFEVSGRQHFSTIAAEFKRDFDRDWKNYDFRLARSPAKDVLSFINMKCSASGCKTFSARALANAHRAEDFPSEVVTVLASIEEMAS